MSTRKQVKQNEIDNSNDTDLDVWKREVESYLTDMCDDCECECNRECFIPQ